MLDLYFLYFTFLVYLPIDHLLYNNTIIFFGEITILIKFDQIFLFLKVELHSLICNTTNQCISVLLKVESLNRRLLKVVILCKSHENKGKNPAWFFIIVYITLLINFLTRYNDNSNSALRWIIIFHLQFSHLFTAWKTVFWPRILLLPH